ncbi:hypothetical protein [Guyparkeria sp.]|uniref:hypothetical protein n=1 Tax=Guyparkeria sp. TaxID=2035736 RepID=UPI003970641F
MSARTNMVPWIRTGLIGVGAVALVISVNTAEAETAAAPVDAYDWMIGVLNESRISNRVGAGASGNMAINLASGSGNMQINHRAINVDSSVNQLNMDMPSEAGVVQHAVTRISGGAFRGASGALGINQVAGDGNVQFNSMTLGGNASGSSEIRTRLPAGPAGEADPAARKDVQSEELPLDRYRTVISNTAFTGFGGLLQVNQVSGNRNVTGNTFTFSNSGP